MKAVLFNILLIPLCSAIFPLHGQTTNTGTLYISPGTEFSTLEDLNNTVSGEFYNDGEAFIYKNFNNDGTVDFYQQTGITRFIGDDPQFISGSEESFLYDVYFNNSGTGSTFLLSGMLNVFGQVDFQNGIVDNDNNGGRFTFMDEADHINTSDFSHVDGPVEKYGNTDFIYPIGDGGYYRFAGISAPQTSTMIFEGKYFLENSATLYPHELKTDGIELIDDQEYWTIRPNGTDEPVLVTLSWNAVTTPAEIIVAPQENNIHIVRWDAGLNIWVDEGGAVNVDETTVTTAVSKYGVFTLARVRSEDVLPCELAVYNTITPNGDGSNDYFIIGPDDTCARNIHVQVYTRWGIKVFETENYGADGNVFRGYSE